jgi:cellulase/cellobiase CelA1
MSHSVAAPDRNLSPAVAEFCARQGLLEHLRRAMALADSCFGPSVLTVEVEADPETDEQVLVITARLPLAADEVLRRKREYTRRWIESAPPAAREKIRLLYDIA